MTKVGVEGTGSYGVGLARFLRRKGIEVVEVNRPNRQARRNQGKSDPLDAVEAARAAISGRASGTGKTKDGPVEAIRVLVVAKRSARQARVKAIVQMRHLGVTAPDQLHSRLKGLTVTALVAESSEAAIHPITRSGDSGHQGVAVVAGPSGPESRSRARRARREDRVAAARHGSRPAGPLRGRARHRGVAAGGGRRQPRTAPFRGRLGPPVRCVAGPGRTRARTPDTCAATTVVTARPTARSGASSWSGSPTTPRPPPISSAG